jgi:MATE family multidrug resistance protein
MAVFGGGADDDALRVAMLASAGGGEEDDLEEIRSVPTFLRRAAEENRRLWLLAGPAIFTSLAQYSLGGVTQVLAGHLTTLELDAVSTENSVIAGLAFGIMYGMGSALETLCGQAYGAKKPGLLGVYLQRSWILLTAMSVLMLPLYLFATPILRFFHQDEEIAVLAGRFSLYMIPQLFAYALNFPIQKFLQAQSIVAPSAYILAASLVLHLGMSWVAVYRLGLGLLGASLTLSLTWWVLVAAQFVYILKSPRCRETWTGFTWAAFADLAGFAKLSAASAVMLALEVWYFQVLILLAGMLPDPRIALDSLTVW